MLRILALLYLGLTLFSCAEKKEKKDPKSPPNVILIFTDDQGYEDIGANGSSNIETPNLDQMAKDGIRLTSFYSAQPICSASRAGILTGCYPNRIGIHNALGPGSPVGINASEMTIAEMLQNTGYKTAIFGKWHLGDSLNFCLPVMDLMSSSEFHTPTICGHTIHNREQFLTLVPCPYMKMKRYWTP